MKFRVRVDRLYEETERVLEEFVKSTKSHCLVYHFVNNNPHYHFYIDDDRYMSCQALRYKIDKLTGSKGHERSVKECDTARVDEYVQYLFNEKHGNKWRLVTTSFDTTAQQAAAAAVAEDFLVKHQKSKTKEITTWEIAEEVKNLYMADNNKYESEYDIYTCHINYAIDVCRKHKKTYTDFSIQRIVQTALTADRRNRQQFVKNVLDRIFRS